MLDTINVAGISILADPDEIYGQTDYFETYVKIYIRENCPIPKIGRKEKQRATHSDNTLAT